MKSFSASLLGCAALCCAVPSAIAHHGQDFLIVQDVHLPPPGQVHFIGNFEWERYNGTGDEFGITPGLMVGLTDRAAFAVDVHFRDEIGTDWSFSSVTPALHFDLTPKSDSFPFKIGFTAGYQFADGGATPAAHDEMAGDMDHMDHDHAEHGHDHAEEGGHSHGGSIHNHDADLFTGRLMVETNIGDTKIVANLIALAGDGSAAWGYAAGVRHKLDKHFAIGGEAMGDFDSQGWQELVAGLYVEPAPSFTFRIGAGFGLTDATPDFTLRTGFVWRF